MDVIILYYDHLVDDVSIWLVILELDSGIE